MPNHDADPDFGDDNIFDVRSPTPKESPSLVGDIEEIRPEGDDRRRIPGWLVVLPAVVILGLLGLLLASSLGGDDPEPTTPLAFGDNPSSSTVTEAPASTEPAVSSTEPASETTSPPTTATPTTAAPTTVPETTTPPTTTTAKPPPTDDIPERGGIYRQGKIYLVGAVRTRGEADAFIEKAAAVIGPDNVIDNYVIDPTAPEASDGRVTVDEPFLFKTNSADLSPEYTPILDLGVVVMDLNPKVRMRIIGHTDAIGDAESNKVLSKQRADEVMRYISFRGIDESRFETIGRGESEPVASNETEEGRAQNRRIEVELIGLLD